MDSLISKLFPKQINYIYGLIHSCIKLKMPRDILKYDFKEGLSQEIEILDMVSLYQEFEQELTSPHRAEFYQILWFQQGNPVHQVDFNPVQIEPNTVVFINKNSVQQFDNTIPFEGKVLLFTKDFFCKEQSDIAFLKSSILFHDLFAVSKVTIPNITPLYTKLFSAINTELAKPKDQYQADVLRNFLRNLLLLSERERRTQDFTEVKKGANLDYVMQFKELLEHQFHHERLVKNYANQMHITIKRLNLATSKILELSPKQIIDDRILLEAKRLLAHTTESVKEISFSLGFDEPTNFVKYFRKHHNTTPLEFRDSVLL